VLQLATRPASRSEHRSSSRSTAARVTYLVAHYHFVIADLHAASSFALLRYCPSILIPAIRFHASARAACSASHATRSTPPEVRDL
jgi:hypothetical protein